MNRNARFEKGSGVYTCDFCGKKTRETGCGESSVHLCVYCYELGGIENSRDDGELTQEEFEAEKAALQTRFGVNKERDARRTASITAGV